MSFTVTLPGLDEAEKRLDDLIDTAFADSTHPAMLDWVTVKFALKGYREMKAQVDRDVLANRIMQDVAAELGIEPHVVYRGIS